MNSFVLLAAVNLLLGGLVFLLGLVILRENLRQRLNRVVALMLFFGGLGSVLAALGFLAAGPGASRPTATLPQGFLAHFSYLWEFFFPTLFLFASVFPEERPFVRRIRGFEILVFLPHLVHFILLLGVSFLGESVTLPGTGVLHALKPLLNLLGLFFQVFLAVHRSLFSLVNLGYGLLSALLLVNSYRSTSVPRLKQQLRVIGVGLILCLSLYSLASSIPVLLNLRISGWVRSLLTIGALTAGSGAIAYSMVRYKFLDTKLLARRGILYAVASAVVVGIYLGVVVQVERFFSDVTGADARVFEPVFLVIALILFQPAMSRLEERLERFFLRDPNDYRNVLKNLGRNLLTEIDLDEMLSASIRTIAEALLLRHAYVVALAREGSIVHAGAGDSLAPPDRIALSQVLNRLPPRANGIRIPAENPDVARADAVFLAERFHADLVFPLRSKGEPVGALILGKKLTGTSCTAEDVNLLSVLAAQMSIAVQNGLLLRERVAVVRMEEELNLARRIQSSFLPSEFPELLRLDVHAVNVPSRQVGGDFYDLVPCGNGTYLAAIADVSGKGVPAALLTSMLQASLRTQAETTRSVTGILSGINSLLCRSIAEEQFATFFLARVEESSLRLTFSNAGHNYPILLRDDGEHSLLVRGGMMVGMFEDARFEEETVQLHPGDQIVLYTDGISEARNAHDEEFGEERIQDLVGSLPPRLPARETARRILDELHRFLGETEPQDDVTVMVIRVRERSPQETAGSPDGLAGQVGSAV